MRLAVLALAVCSIPAFGQYSIQHDGDVVRLVDSAAKVTVSVVPSFGNVAIGMTVNGENILRFPFASLDDFKKSPTLCGIPLLAPWGNRLDHQGFYANGKAYNFNMELGNVKGAIPIHGFLTYSTDWKLVEAKADKQAAWVTSRLEVWRQPSSMAQWPFAHAIVITHRLQKGILEVRTRIENLSTEPMPVAIGFHPYFQLTDSPRDEWTISVGARTEWPVASGMPTGVTRPIEQMFPDPKSVPLKDYSLDNVFGDLIRDASGFATMTVKGKKQQLDVSFGPNFHSAVVFAPNRNRQPAAGAGRGAAAPGAAAGDAGRGPGGQQAAAGDAGRGPGGQQAAAGDAGRGPGGPQAAPGGAGRGAPAGPAQNQSYICFEPMSGITNALNLAQKGVYKELQSIPAGGTWQESFFVKPSGF